MKKVIFMLFFVVASISTLFAENNNGYDIVKKSFQMWKGQQSSISHITMVINRPDREESISLKTWSKGEDQSISRFLAPAKYKGQAILVQKDSMWSYSSKSRRSIKISNSLKSKPWEGSDMSYDDISVSMEPLKQFSYQVKRGIKNKNNVYIVQANPIDATMGKEIYYIRISDNALLSKEFFNQNGVIIKRFDAVEISYYQKDKQKPFMKHMRVTNLEKEGYFTDFKIEDIQFNVEISEDTFSLANLERP